MSFSYYDFEEIRYKVGDVNLELNDLEKEVEKLVEKAESYDTCTSLVKEIEKFAENMKQQLDSIRKILREIDYKLVLMQADVD